MAEGRQKTTSKYLEISSYYLPALHIDNQNIGFPKHCNDEKTNEVANESNNAGIEDTCKCDLGSICEQWGRNV